MRLEMFVNEKRSTNVRYMFSFNGVLPVIWVHYICFINEHMCTNRLYMIYEPISRTKLHKSTLIVTLLLDKARV